MHFCGDKAKFVVYNLVCLQDGFECLSLEGEWSDGGQFCVGGGVFSRSRSEF